MLRKLRACSDFAFDVNAGKFYSEQGVMKEHSHSYVTEEQRGSGQNLVSAAQRVKPEQALNIVDQITALLQCGTPQLYHEIAGNRMRYLPVSLSSFR